MIDAKGRITSITSEYFSDNTLITVALDKVSDDTLSKLQNNVDYQISIALPTEKKKRSLTANAYFHVLVGKYAESLTISKARAKNELICKYGQVELIDDEPMIYKSNAPVEYMREQEFIHALPVKFSEENGKSVTFYKLYRGSHTYNVNEMRLLIEGTVADCKELGIDTETNTSINKMLEAWGREYDKKRTN